MKRIFCLVVSICICFQICMPLYANENKDDSSIVIVHTNDAHCQIDPVENEDSSLVRVGYECVAGVKKEMEESYSNVSLVDAGDHIQGKPVGVLTQGEAIIHIMNEVGYTMSTLGNHEFDYGIEQLQTLTEMADYPYVSCNFYDLTTNSLVYEPYYMEEYETSQGIKKVAYIGVTTPESISKSNPEHFKDENGNYIYGFCQDETGEALYNAIQSTVDETKKAGADYVIIVGHLGQTGVSTIWRSDTIVQNIRGVDAVIDGHSHEEYIQTVKDLDGKDVLITQTGVYLNAVGVMKIDVETGQISAEIEHASLPYDTNTREVVNQTLLDLDSILSEKVADSDVDLYVLQEDGKTWKVRSSETNMGDLVTDAYREVMGADIGISGGGGIRSNISKGEVTYNDLLSVQPFGNNIAIIKVTGQQLLDALEMGCRTLPDFCGGFLQVSGMSYKINTSIESSVVVDVNNMFVKVDGNYRVWDVKVGDEPLDLNKTYTVASTEFDLLQCGDGLSMFENCEVVVSAGPKDFEVLALYVKDYLNGKIDQEYEGRNGQGRIVFEEEIVEETNPIVIIAGRIFLLLFIVFIILKK